MATYRNSYNDGVRVSPDFLGYPWIEIDEDTEEPVEEQTEFTVMTADAILAEVGDDPELAAAALAEEQEREQPRTVLSAKLQRIIDNAE